MQLLINYLTQFSLTRNKLIVLLIWWGIVCPAVVSASVNEYSCEVGVQAGCGYYVGDATKMIFMNPRDVFGAQFRYKFNQRWAMQIKGQRQRIAYSYRPDATEDNPFPLSIKYQNPMWNMDVTAEFNFFRFGVHPFDSRIKSVTPFVSLGVGITMCNRVADTLEFRNYPAVDIMKNENGITLGGFYIPVGIGVKWKFAERWQLQACWQHQIYFSDNIEGCIPDIDNVNEDTSVLNNANGLNGSKLNIFNNDLVSSLTVGIVFEFGERETMCYFCDE